VRSTAGRPYPLIIPQAPGGVREAPTWLPGGLLEASWGLLGSLGRFGAPGGGFGEVLGEDSGTLGPAKTWFIRVRGCKNHKNGGSGKGSKKAGPKPLSGVPPPWGSFGVSRGSLARLLGSLGIPWDPSGVSWGPFGLFWLVPGRLFGGSDFVSAPLGGLGWLPARFWEDLGYPPGWFWEDFWVEVLKKIAVVLPFEYANFRSKPQAEYKKKRKRSRSPENLR